MKTFGKVAAITLLVLTGIIMIWTVVVPFMCTELIMEVADD